MSKFVECDTCQQKPGTPVLCPSCLTNRSTIAELEGRIAELKTLNKTLKDGFIMANELANWAIKQIPNE